MEGIHCICAATFWILNTVYNWFYCLRCGRAPLHYCLSAWWARPTTAANSFAAKFNWKLYARMRTHLNDTPTIEHQQIVPIKFHFAPITQTIIFVYYLPIWMESMVARSKFTSLVFTLTNLIPHALAYLICYLSFCPLSLSLSCSRFSFPSSLFHFLWCRRTTSGNGCALIFVYMTYTMLPVRLREALVGGLLLSGVHIYFSMNHSTAVNWPEVCVVYLSQLYD